MGLKTLVYIYTCTHTHTCIHAYTHTHTHTGVSFNVTSNSDTSRVVLLPSLFKSHPALLDQPGLVFTSYSTSILFPLTQYEKPNSTRLSMIGSSVLGATVVTGQPAAIKNLTEPIVMDFKVNHSMVGRMIFCACTSHVKLHNYYKQVIIIRSYKQQLFLPPVAECYFHSVCVMGL